MDFQTRGPVRLGIELLLEESSDLIRGRRIGIIAAAASVDRQFRGSVDRLVHYSGTDVVALFGPEHGLYGEAQAGKTIEDSVDEQTQIPVYSLYGKNKKPSQQSLANLDMLVIDLVDVGCRYWTFPYTMAYAMEAAAEAGIPVVVTDRPNPITGIHVEGNVLNPKFSSFLGLYPIPMRTGLTLGELALLFNAEYGINADLTVVPAKGWQRSMWYDETGLPFVPPSPNSPTLDMLTLYPGTCLIEGTNISEGRGTTRPFEIIGAPWIKPRRLADRLIERQLPGVAFRPVYFTPTFNKFSGQRCGGVHIHITDRESLPAVRVGLHVIDCIMQEDPSSFQWKIPDQGTPHIDLLAGTDTLRLDMGQRLEPDELLQQWERQLDDFTSLSSKFHLY